MRCAGVRAPTFAGGRYRQSRVIACAPASGCAASPSAAGRAWILALGALPRFDISPPNSSATSTPGNWHHRGDVRSVNAVQSNPPDSRFASFEHIYFCTPRQHRRGTSVYGARQTHRVELAARGPCRCGHRRPRDDSASPGGASVCSINRTAVFELGNHPQPYSSGTETLIEPYRAIRSTSRRSD